jgi:hypothetical protein
MKPAIFGSFANSIAFPDLRWTSDEGLSVSRVRIEVLSGLTVALALVPEAVAFAFVAGVHPLVGLYAAFFGWACHCPAWRTSGDDFRCNWCVGRCDGGIGC